MKRLVILIVLFGLLLSGCSAPAKPVKITWWSEAASTPWLPFYNIPEFEKGEFGNIVVEMWKEANPKYSNVEVEVLAANYSGGGRDPLLDAMIAAGQPPALVDGYAGRYSALLDAAIDLDPYLTQAQRDSLYYYEPGQNFVAHMGVVEYGLVNATVLKSVGIEPPEPWAWVSRDEFLSWAEPLKASGLYLSCNFCAGQSSMQWNWAWFGNSGLQVWEDGYTGVSLNTPEGVKVMEELVRLNQEGYFVPGAEGMIDDDCIFSNWTLNKYAYFQGGRLSFMPWFNGAVESGEIPEVPEIVPVMGIGDGGLLETQRFTNITFVTMWAPEEVREAAASLAYFAATGPTIDRYPCALPNMAEHEAKAGLPEEELVIEYAKSHGMDSGTFTPAYNEARRIFGEYFGAAIRGEITSAEALAGFEADVEAILE